MLIVIVWWGLSDSSMHSVEMDAMPCHWNGASGQESFQRPRPLANTLSRLAELIARVEHKQDGHVLKPQQPSPSVCKDCGEEFPDLAVLGWHQQKEHALPKPHCCPRCGLEFALASTMQLHRCPDVPAVCQVCRGKPERGSTCPSCLAQAPGPHGPEEPQQPHHLNHRLHHDVSPYACAPCGRAFGHKQDLLHHQQAGGCQPAPLSPEALAPPSSPAPALSPDHTPSPSQAALPPTPSGTDVGPCTCALCFRTFRSAAGLASHRRHVHTNRWKRRQKKLVMTTERETPATRTTERETPTTGQSFPCRSCDKVFSQTSTLYLHRKEVHRREVPVARQQRNSVKSARQRRKGETYPCLHCGKVFLHHLTRWAHFKSYSSHYQTHLSSSAKLSKTHTAGKGVKDLRVANGHKFGPPPNPCKEESKILKNPNQKVKRHVASRAGRQEDGPKEEEEEEGKDEEREFPCPSCAEVFTSRSSLRQHEEVHQSSVVSNHCSVCTGGIKVPETEGSAGTRVYHCVPCAEGFVDLDGFLQHCKTHLHISDDDDEGEKDSDHLGSD
ncbi:uncharacterized protein LOC143484728 isoform X2 [Brachyhypopomus gauderio]|uniref:uncharacterized protein LOC143484728 isoform X2 n=1 Tax=Brachyhypopomus gauderio TaxID=698409 RepID=UPI0040428D21